MLWLIFLNFFIFKAFTRMLHHHILPNETNLKLSHIEPTFVNFQYLPTNNKEQVHTTKFPLRCTLLLLSRLLYYFPNLQNHRLVVIHVAGASMIVRCEPGLYVGFPKFASSKMFDIMSLSSTFFFHFSHPFQGINCLLENQRARGNFLPFLAPFWSMHYSCTKLVFSLSPSPETLVKD